MSNKPKRFLVSGGGSGGHIYPAVAIIEAIRRHLPNAEFQYVGASGKMEMEKIPALGYDIENIPVDGVQRSMSMSNLIRNIKLPFKLMYSFFKLININNKFKPNAAIGTGGYVSGPTIKIAQWMGIPTYIQEQNALPGYTNRLLSAGARYVFTSFESSKKYFTNSRVLYTGNPIRSTAIKSELTPQESRKLFGLDPDKQTVFVTGGSLGAGTINKAIADGLDRLRNQNIQLIWQTGKRYYDQYQELAADDVIVLGFVDKMNEAYNAADIIVTRAGGALFEMFIVAKPLIVLPSPYVAEDHQTQNAKDLVSKHAAIMVTDSEADEKLVDEIIALLGDSERMNAMHEAVKKLAMPHAADTIAETIIQDLKYSKS